MAQLSDDCFATGGALMGADEALSLLEARLHPVAGRHSVELAEAAGRVLAEDVVAGLSVPPHDNAAVDGYAVFFDDLATDRDTTLAVAGRLAAGQAPQVPVGRGQAMRIFTGAPVPPGPDTIMMQEDCVAAGDRVTVRPGIRRGANLRKAGEDIAAGAVILRAGQRLRPQDIGLAASVGRTQLAVYRGLAVALFSTGDELREPGDSLPPGAVYDANRYTLRAALEALGCTVTDLGIIPDRSDAVHERIAAAAAGHDVIVTSGGVSTGEEDHVRAAVEALGVLYFWRLAIRPGRPIALGRVGTAAFIGLPGNPAAMMVTFLRFARPAILRLGGVADTSPRFYRVRAAFSHKKKPNRREWVRVRLRPGGDGVFDAVKFPREGAGILSSMVEADGLVELPEALTELAAGTMVDFLPFTEVS